MIHRTEKRVMHEILCWTVASELQTEPSSNLWLWPPSMESDDDADSLLFLLGERPGEPAEGRGRRAEAQKSRKAGEGQKLAESAHRSLLLVW